MKNVYIKVKNDKVARSWQALHSHVILDSNDKLEWVGYEILCRDDIISITVDGQQIFGNSLSTEDKKEVIRIFHG